MTFSVGEAMVVLRGSQDQLKTDLDDAKRDTNSWAKGLGGTASKFIAGAVVGGAVAMGTAVVGVGAAALSVGSDMDSAQRNLQAQLGVTKMEAVALGDTAKSVWTNNFAGSITEAADAVGKVRQVMGLAGDDLQDATENAFRLSDAYGVDVTNGIDTAKTLMDNFNLTQQEAFDLMASGYQQGLNRAGDFADTVNEYSTHFAGAGASAEQFFGFLQTGLAGGMLGTDKAADAFKEFSVRIMDGSATTADALDSLGFDSDEFVAGLADGTIDIADAFGMVTTELWKTEDQAKQFQAGVGLLGTQFEDLGTDAALGLELIGDAFEDSEGSIDAVDAKYGDLSSVVEGFKRKALGALEPIGSRLLDAANNIMPKVEQAFEAVQPYIEGVADAIELFFDLLDDGVDPVTALSEAFGAVMELFGASEEDVASVKEAIQSLWEKFQEFKDNLMEFLGPILEAIGNFVSFKDVLIVLGAVIGGVVLSAILSLVSAFAPILAVIAIAIGVVALLRNAWENNWGGIQEKVGAVLEFIRNLINEVVTWLSNFWAEHGDTIKAKAEEIWTAIQAAIETAINTISEVVNTVITALQEFWAEHGDTILAKAEEIWNAIQGVIETVTAIISEVFAAFKSAFEGDWTAFGENLRDAWDIAWNAIKDFITEFGPQLLEAITAIIDNIILFITETDWIQIGRDMIQGIANGISAATHFVVDAARAAIRAAIDAITGFLESDSPSKLTARVAGKPMAQGVVVGWEDELAASERALNASLAGAIDTAAALPPSSGVASNSGQTIIYQVDARGASPGMEQKIRDMLRDLQREQAQTTRTRLNFTAGA